MAGPKHPYTLRRGMHNNCFAATRCIRATLFGKTDDLQFASLRVDVLIRKTPRRVQGLCSMAQAAPLGTTGSYTRGDLRQ
jgi:hypothetical protein